MNLYFQNSYGKERFIAECDSVQDIHKAINKFLDEHDYKSYYSRSREHHGRVKIDVGSHTEFFFVEGISYEEYIEALCSEADDAYYESQQPKEEYHQITFDEYLESLQNS